MTDSLGGWLERARERADRGITLVDRRERERRLPWPELVARAEDVAGGLHALGVEPGERVALAFPTGEGFLAGFLGALHAGAVPVPLPPPSRLGNLGEQQRRLAAMLAAATPRLLLAEDAVLPLLDGPIAAAPLPLGARSLAELPRGVAHTAAVDDDAPGLVQFSSGTTTAPKPVLLSRRALAVQARLLNALWPDGEADGSGESLVQRGFSWLPLHHDMGLVGCLLPALERPADLVLLPPEAFVARPALWLRGIARTRATVSPAPTFAFAHALRRVRDEELAGVDLSRWRYALCGAEAVSPQTLDAFARRFARWGFRAEAITAVYGLAEAGLGVTFGALDAPPTVRRFARRALLAGRAVEDADGREVAGVGLPLPGFAVAVRDEDGADLGDGRVGSVWVRGPSLMEGYLGDARATARALVDGWLDTGDLGFLDARGELFLVGRQKDLVIVRGRNHAPEEIEEAAARVAGVRAGGVAALGFLPERGEEEELLLLVERERGDEVDGIGQARPRLPRRGARCRRRRAGAGDGARARHAAAHLLGQAAPRRGAAPLARGRARRADRRRGPAVRHDLLIVGGGPAGLAAALAAKQRGITPLVLERQRPPIDKACGEGIMPDGVAALRELGVEPPGMPFRGIRYLDEHGAAEAPFPGAPGRGVRRTTLHAAMVEAVERAGIEVRWGEKVDAVTLDGEVRTSNGTLRSEHVVGADGLLSHVRGWAGLAGPPPRRRRFGVRRHFRLAPWTDLVEVHWRDDVEAYVTPVGTDEIGVAMLWNKRDADSDGGSGRGGDDGRNDADDRDSFELLLSRFPELAARLGGVPETSRDRGAGPFRQRAHGLVRGRVVLIGDAAGYFDAITGEGLGLSFQQAEALGDALQRGNLDEYVRACRRLAQLTDALTATLLFCERRPWLRRRLVRELGRRPALFSRLLGAHARQLSLRQVGGGAFAALLLGLLRP